MRFKRTYSVLVASFLALNLAFLTPVLGAMASMVPSGTTLKLMLRDDLSTKKNEVGDKFTAELVDPIVIDGSTMIPRGTKVEGSITKLEKPKRLAGLKGKASMVLSFDRIRTRGEDIPIAATLVSVHDPINKSEQREEIERAKKSDEKVKEEGEVEAKNDTRDMAIKGAIGVAAGTVLGALFGNISRGLLLGSIGGAVAILAPKGKDVTLPEGTGLQVRLDRDLEVSRDFRR
jgi:hypothetical protein